MVSDTFPYFTLNYGIPQMPFDFQSLINSLKWFSAHAAAFGGLAAFVSFLVARDYNNAIAALLAALAGFGLNINPKKQATL